jgi:tripeptide aminopeptidase
MVNAQLVFMEFNAMLPVEQRPEYTAEREGYIHLWKMSEGSVEHVQGAYLLRDHDAQKFDTKEKLMQECADFINKKYGAGTVRCAWKSNTK